MSFPEIVYIGVPVVCFSVMAGLFIGALCATAHNADAHLEFFDQAPHEAAEGHGCPVAAELGSICDRYTESVN
jgi:hypothetical protein